MSASTQSVMWPGLDNTAVKPQTIEQRSKNENSTLSRNTIQHESWIKRQQNHSRSFDSRRTDSQMNHLDESDSNKSSKEPLFIHKCQAKPSEQSAIPSCSAAGKFLDSYLLIWSWRTAERCCHVTPGPDWACDRTESRQRNSAGVKG